MTKSLFVAGLDYSINDSELQEIFESCGGSVESAKVIMDRNFNPARSRGFGFVDLADDDYAKKCVEELNEAEVKGRKIVVKFKEPKPQNNKFGGRR